MNSKDYIEEIKKYFTTLITEVKINTAYGHYDINSVAENFYIPILKYIYGCNDLENQNIIKYNFPAIDLGCKSTKTSFQVTSSADSKKIIKTIEKFKEHDLQKEYDKLYVLIITEKQKSYKSKKLLEAADVIGFDVEHNIIDYKDLIKVISEKDVIFLEGLVELLKREFKKNTTFTICRNELNKFLDLSSSRISVEKNSKKYIPDVFVESNHAKDKARFFAHPAFFHRKIFDTLNTIDYTWINEHLLMMGVDMIDSCIPDIITCFKTNSLEDIKEHLNKLKNTIKKEIDKINQYSGYEEITSVKVPEGKESYKAILRIKVGNISYGLLRKLKEALSQIDLCLSKVLLITSMAGQGKTNFVCDFVDNFCKKFEVPVILIPARELNGIKDHSIFSYIINNKYLKDIDDKFQLLSFFNEVASKLNKPFLIIIDGINEVKKLDLFNNVLSDFIDTTTQYKSVKIMLTCRSEFFEKKYASLMSKSFSEYIHHLKDIKSDMSDFHLEQAIKKYFRTFNIQADLSDKARDFLKNDLLLLRIFCEYNQNKNLGWIQQIYKDQLYEEYLISIIDKFHISLKKLALPVLYKLVENMLSSDDYTSLPIDGFSQDETLIIEKLVSEDVILRRELPVKTLESIGVETVNFTYDELRDFIIAHYLVNSVSKLDMPIFAGKFDNVSKYQIYEGVSKYTYILARKNNNKDVIAHLEAKEDFEDLYPIVLYSLPPEYQMKSDIAISKRILSKNLYYTTEQLAIYLHTHKSKDQLLNISLLIDHINSLDDDGLIKFVECIFDDRHRARGTKNLNKYVRERLDIIQGNVDKINDNVFIFMMQVSSVLDTWLYHSVLMAFIKVKEIGKKLDCFTYVEKASSKIIKDFISQIITGTERV